MTVVRLAVEGKTDAPVAERIVRLVGLEPLISFVAGGKTKLDPRIPGVNRLAAGTNWLILRDLDHDALCPPALVHDLVAGQAIASRLSLRIVVRASESWLLADMEGFASEFSVGRKHVPASPDDRNNPKGGPAPGVPPFGAAGNPPSHDAASAKRPESGPGVPGGPVRRDSLGPRARGPALPQPAPGAGGSPTTRGRRSLVVVAVTGGKKRQAGGHRR